MLPFGAWVIVRMVAPGKKLSLTSAGSIVVDDTTYAKVFSYVQVTVMTVNAVFLLSPEYRLENIFL